MEDIENTDQSFLSLWLARSWSKLFWKLLQHMGEKKEMTRDIPNGFKKDESNHAWLFRCPSMINSQHWKIWEKQLVLSTWVFCTTSLFLNWRNVDLMHSVDEEFNFSASNTDSGTYCILHKIVDGTKLCGAVDTMEGRHTTEGDLNRLERWFCENTMKFKKAKCKILHLSQYNLKHKYRLGRELIESKLV